MDVYHAMIDEVLNTGTRKENRTGVDTLSTFNFNYELCWDRNLWNRGYSVNQSYLALQGDPAAGNQPPEGSHLLPLLTTKDISWKNIVVEMLWFLSGETDIEILKRHKCKFWDAWADENGRVPSAYGNFWRQFPVHHEEVAQDGLPLGPPRAAYNDQLAWVVNQLRTNPMSRRLVISAWGSGQRLEEQAPAPATSPWPSTSRTSAWPRASGPRTPSTNSASACTSPSGPVTWLSASPTTWRRTASCCSS